MARGGFFGIYSTSWGCFGVAPNGGVVAPPNGELVPTYGVYIVPWAPTMDIDTSTASSALLIVEI